MLLRNFVRMFSAERDKPPLVKLESSKVNLKRIHQDKLFRPKHIFLIRHGESLGNVNADVLATMPDNQLPLTEQGKQQCNEAGATLTSLVHSGEKLRFYVSPYRRTWETYLEIVKHFDEKYIVTREEPRLREQDFGNFQPKEDRLRWKAERRQFGSFYYRFPQGESGSDVYDRVSTFIETLHREFAKPECAQHFVLVTHGLTARLFLMRYFHWSVEKFHRMHNLENGQIVTMKLGPYGKYTMEDSLREDEPDESEWIRFEYVQSLIQPDDLIKAQF